MIARWLDSLDQVRREVHGCQGEGLWVLSTLRNREPASRMQVSQKGLLSSGSLCAVMPSQVRKWLKQESLHSGVKILWLVIIKHFFFSDRLKERTWVECSSCARNVYSIFITVRIGYCQQPQLTGDGSQLRGERKEPEVKGLPGRQRSNAWPSDPSKFRLSFTGCCA